MFNLCVDQKPKVVNETLPLVMLAGRCAVVQTKALAYLDLSSTERVTVKVVNLVSSPVEIRYIGVVSQDAVLTTFTQTN